MELLMFYLLLFRQRHIRAVHALHNCLMEEISLLFCNEMKFHRSTTSTLSVNRDAVGVATKSRYMFLNPFQGFGLILEAGVQIPKVRVIDKIGRSEEPKCVQAVIDGHYYNIWALINPVFIGPIAGVSIDVASAMDVKQYGDC